MSVCDDAKWAVSQQPAEHGATCSAEKLAKRVIWVECALRTMQVAVVWGGLLRSCRTCSRRRGLHERGAWLGDPVLFRPLFLVRVGKIVIVVLVTFAGQRPRKTTRNFVSLKRA